MKRQTAYRFFYSQAGYGYQPDKETKLQGKRRCAKQLAAAERLASDRGYSFRWQVDTMSDSSDWSDEEPAYAQWQCDMLDSDGKFVNGLGGVDFGRDKDPWGDPYRRVVEAELALEIVE